MSEEEMIKEAYILMVKNNPDEAIKNLIRLDKELAVKNNKLSKAIEYIEKEPIDDEIEYTTRLLDILRGEDNDNFGTIK